MTFTLEELDRHSLIRPPGYRAAVLALATRDGDHYTLTPDAVEKIRAQFAPKTSRVRSLLNSLAVWFRNGCPRTPDALLKRRQGICAKCPHWNQSFPATCTLCGCKTGAKLRLATAICPDSPPRW